MVQEYNNLRLDNGIVCFKDATEDFEGFVKKFNDYTKGKNLPEGWVPASHFWLVNKDNLIIGSSGFLHKLTPYFRKYRGHIGYFIRPSQRQKGYGKLILALTLEKAKQFGLQRVLVNCYEDNIASKKIIEANGGVLEDIIMDENRKVPKRRYWIEL